MFRLNLILKKKTNNILVLSPPVWFRIFFMIFAGIIFLGIITISKDSEHGSFVLPVCVAIFCIFASLYKESWIFDKTKKCIISQTGLLFINKRRIIDFSDVFQISVYSFLRGREIPKENMKKSENPFSKENTAEVQGQNKIMHKKYHQELRINLKSGDFIVIESLDKRNTVDLKQKAQQISSFTGISIVE